MTTYTNQNLGGYNANAPPDDGSSGSVNEISWNREKASLADPLRNFSDDINNEISAAIASLESEIFQVATTHTGPAAPVFSFDGILWYNIANNVLYVRHAGYWKALVYIDPISHIAYGYRALQVESADIQAGVVGRNQLKTSTFSVSGTIIGTNKYTFQLTARAFVPMLYSPAPEYPVLHPHSADTGADAPVIAIQGTGIGTYGWTARWRYLV